MLMWPRLYPDFYLGFVIWTGIFEAVIPSVALYNIKKGITAEDKKFRLIACLVPRYVCIVFSSLTYIIYAKGETPNAYWIASLYQQLECCTSFCSFPGFFKKINSFAMNIKSSVGGPSRKEDSSKTSLTQITDTNSFTSLRGTTGSNTDSELADIYRDGDAPPSYDKATVGLNPRRS